MEVTAGAISPLLRKLGELLMDEYSLEKHVRKRVKSLQTELTIMHAALLKVAEVPRDQLDPQVSIWAGLVRGLSYDMEDAVEAFMVRVEDEEDRACAGDPTNLKNRVKKFFKKTTRLFKKGKDLHQIAGAIEEAQDLAKQLAELRQRYGGLELHDSSAGATIDPRLTARFKDAKEFVGINDTRDELIKMLSVSVQSEQQLKTVSIVGFGGLGKTTLARAVYDKVVDKRTLGMAVYDKIVEAHFRCGAFVSVGRDSDLKKVLKDLLYELDKEKYENIHNTARDETPLIGDLREFLRNKRYFIVIDDIWKETLWKSIKCAFPEDNLGSRLITTTRNVSVSEACCTTHDDIIYKMKPLPGVYARRLFYKRIFPHGNRCPRELEEVSEDILKKCGGVPLAIITIASLLAKQVRTKDQWKIVLNSIGRGLTEGGDVKDMQMILSFSYYDLPSHLKPCLLYLSIFPEDYEIGRDRLIWRWIAEGFVQPEKEGDNLFELGGSYFNELINRSMIQPVYGDYTFSVEACIVHDMVLDLIYSLSREENFVTISDKINTCSQSNVIRRLSLQNIKVEHTAPHQATGSMSKVRSITLFSPAINLMPSLSRFKVLRVLDLEGCDLRQSCHLNFSHLGNLFHLRYLGLRNTWLCELPREIEKLQFLLTLDLRGANIKQLPSTVLRMKQLMCLLVESDAMVLDGTGNLTSLEVLGTISIRMSPNFAEALRSLTRLRELEIFFDVTDESSEIALMDSLSTLQEIQTLVIHAGSSSLELMGAAGWVPPPHLRRLEVDGLLSRLPAWVESLSHLASLKFDIWKLPQEDLQILARLPALRFFHIVIRTSIWLLVGAGFPCLRAFILFNDGQIMFQEGAMPRVESVEFGMDFDGSGDFELGLGNLLSLEEANITLYGTNAHEVKEAEVALRHAADNHPNHPTLRLLGISWKEIL